MQKLAEVGSDLATLGCAMAWMVVQAEKHRRMSGRSKSLWSFLAGPFAGSMAVHRPLKKRTFPIRLGSLWKLWATLEDCSLEDVSGAEFVEEWKADAWLFNCVQYSNFLGGCRVFHWGRWRESDQRAIAGFKEAVARTLAQDGSVKRSVSEVEKELSSRFMSYTGEEIPKMEVLSISQVEPSLPPPSHGGAIRAIDWVKGRTKAFLLHPDDCIRTPDEANRLPRLQGKVHVVSEDKLELAKLLVARGICGWTEESDVFRFQGERVLNGLFGVPKSTCLSDGRPVLRLIMNLIPSNSVMRQLQGSVQELPGITQYLSVTLEHGESIRFSQSDMTAAFYLFGLEERWMRYLCFNLNVKGSEIGKVPTKEYFLSCKVLPMGWTSAVAVMQEISQSMLLCYGLPKELQVKRTRGLPLWLCNVLRDAGDTSKAWWRIYLDNFFAGEKSQGGNSGKEVDNLHSLAEQAWAEIGVISSEKKRVSGVETVDELGARFNGSEQYLGASGERLIKILQTTALVLSKINVPKKWLQVISGRWIHVMQFRRCAMSTLHLVWKWIGGRRLGGQGLVRAREELFMLMLGCPLFHTFLGSEVSEVVTCSDASNKGGAVGSASELSDEGCDFSVSQINLVDKGPLKAESTMILSVLVSCEIEAAAVRVVSRRWPQAIQVGDIRDINESMVRGWLFQFPGLLAIHLWAGFPCVDLSSVKFGRKNLRGTESSLFFEIIRVLRLIRSIFGTTFEIVFFVENVASMDLSAVEEISQHLGCKPFRVQCSQAVPISRPRLCWSNVQRRNLPGIKMIERDYYTEIVAEAEYPFVSQWLREGCVWKGQTQQLGIFPTSMKSIRRTAPPPMPAGISRCDEDTLSRWRSDKFRYPPYQYKPEYIIYTSAGKWRLIDSSERELLHGYGWGHTSLCWSASKIKQDLEGYESTRCSEVGDSFSIYSFCIFAWMSFFDLLPRVDYQHLCNRMGLAPGYCVNIAMTCPLQRKLGYGTSPIVHHPTSTLTRILLSKVNHTGSDIRVSTGAVMCPKAYPRQSGAADWWKWKAVFSCRWTRPEHINGLEMRAILLALQWRVSHLKEVNVRILHLTDSYVCMSIISKGRTSSDLLLTTLRRIAALCFSFGIYPILLHVESSENPTDSASRQ